MRKLQIDFMSQSQGDFPDFLIAKGLVDEFELFLETNLLPLYEKIKSDDWTYIFSFDLVEIRESDALQRSSYPFVPNAPRSSPKDRIKLVSIGLPGNEVVESDQPMVTLGKLMEEAIIQYFSMQKKTPSQQDLEKVFARFPWPRIENLPYPPGEEEIFRSPF